MRVAGPGRWARLVAATAIVGVFAALGWSAQDPKPPTDFGPQPASWLTIPAHRLTRTLDGLARAAARFADPPRLLRRISTDDAVVFVTIDDGWSRSRNAARLIERTEMPATAFVLTTAIHGERLNYFRELAAAGVRMENHTRTHPYLPALRPRRAQREICGASRQLARSFGRRPVLFRPPYGGWRPRLMRAIDRCGMHTVVLWNAEIMHGRLTTRQGRGLRAGDIVLLHFRRDLRRDLEVLRIELRRRGLRVAPLERYL